LSSTGFVPNWSSKSRIYEISPKNIEVLKHIGVLAIAEILQKSYEQLNNFEKILLRAIHWFASSQTQIKIENEFLNLITCLEVFFTQEGGDPISNSIAEGVALTLGEDLLERKRLKKRIKDLHRLRSKVSHGGNSSILIKDIADLKAISRRLLVKMIECRETFNDREQLVDWLEDKKLA
jgi:hypothetical protein